MKPLQLFSPNESLELHLVLHIQNGSAAQELGNQFYI
jgi:hypothetical protein